MIWTAFLLGFLGSFHCLGMCGPIALTVAAKDNSPFLRNKIIYNLGRTITYSILGLFIGILGFSLALSGFQQWISLLMGVLILMMAFFHKQSERLVAHSGLRRWIMPLKSSLGYFLKQGGATAFFTSGLLNGLLPCGMVYIALAASLAMQSVFYGTLYMFFFGIGTVPMLLGVMVSGKMFSLSLRQKLVKGLPYFAMFIGILFIFRGLGLGIYPYSPKLQTFDYGTEKVEITMCQ